MKDMWFGRKLSAGIKSITVDTDDEGIATENLLAGLLESIGQFNVEEKIKVAGALGLESSQLNMATIRSIAKASGEVIDYARLGAAIVNPGVAIASGVDRLAQGDYIGAVGELGAPALKVLFKGAGAAGNVLRSGGGGDDVVTMFRAVSKAELDDIAIAGFRQKPGGLSFEGKLFATSAEDAARYGRELYKLDKEAFHVIQVRVSRSVADQYSRHTMDRMTAIYVAKEQLGALNASAVVSELPSIPIR